MLEGAIEIRDQREKKEIANLWRFYFRPEDSNWLSEVKRQANKLVVHRENK